MISFFLGINPIFLSFLAGLFTFLFTVLGSSVVFFFKKINKNFLDGMLGFSAGVMIAASFFSLLSPAFDLANSLNIKSSFIVSLGFLCGGVFLFISDKTFTKVIKKEKNKSIKRSIMLVLSITLHNIPEGLAIGVAYGLVYLGVDSVFAAFILTIGIAIQNFPEGSAISLPLRREGVSRKKSFIIGSMSAIVEPIFSLLGAILVIKIRIILPFLLAFAAGAMIYVVVEEIIPESQTNKSKDLMAIFTILGFLVMMILDTALS